MARQTTAGGVALNQEQLTIARVFLGAIGQFARQRQAFERAFADDRFAGFTGCFAGARRGQTLLDDASSVGRILRQELVQSSVDDGLYGGTNLGIVELVLGL